MRNVFLFIIFGFVLAGCRAKLEKSSSRSYTSTDEIGLELHRFDSLWNSLSERLTYKIEFYPTDNGSTPTKPDNCVPIDPKACSHMTTLPPSGSSGGVGCGSVKSIEITTETDAEKTTVFKTDSVSQAKRDTSEASQTETSSEAKHDNSTVLILSIVGGLVVIGAVVLVLKKFVKR